MTEPTYGSEEETSKIAQMREWTNKLPFGGFMTVDNISLPALKGLINRLNKERKDKLKIKSVSETQWKVVRGKNPHATQPITPVPLSTLKYLNQTEIYTMSPKMASKHLAMDMDVRMRPEEIQHIRDNYAEYAKFVIIDVPRELPKKVHSFLRNYISMQKRKKEEDALTASIYRRHNPDFFLTAIDIMLWRDTDQDYDEDQLDNEEYMKRNHSPGYEHYTDKQIVDYHLHKLLTNNNDDILSEVQRKHPLTTITMDYIIEERKKAPNALPKLPEKTLGQEAEERRKVESTLAWLKETNKNTWRKEPS